MLKQAEMMEGTYSGVHKELNRGQRRQTKQSRVEILCVALSVSVIVQVMYCVGFSVLYAVSFSSSVRLVKPYSIIPAVSHSFCKGLIFSLSF